MLFRSKDGVLYVNKAEAIACVSEEKRFAKVDLELARPGESARIIPVKDAVEPRVKMDGKGYYPGFSAPMSRCGEGRTFVLDGAAVITCGPIVAFQKKSSVCPLWFTWLAARPTWPSAPTSSRWLSPVCTVQPPIPSRAAPSWSPPYSDRKSVV